MNNRNDLIKRIKKKLVNGNITIGTWQQIPNASISEILGHAGYDWVAVDMEHGSINVEQLPNLFRAIELGETLPLARIAEAKPKDCKQALDAGAGGIIAPMIDNADQLKMVRNACCWPPVGNRGVGFSRANLFGKNFESYKEEAQSPLLVAQIEHINAVNNLDEILQVEGLDAIIVGPYDLSASMGITADFKNEKFINVMAQIKKLCDKANKSCGEHIVYPEPAMLEKRISEGYRFIAYSIDAVFLMHNLNNPLKNKEGKQ
jgi:2-dehydro-3-deoxyglucarate aldolase